MESSLKKHRLVLSILMSIAVVFGVTSIFPPYLVKLNILSSNLILPHIYEGYHYGLTKVILIFMTANLFSIAFSRTQIISVILSVIVLILVWLLRYSIHFQGFIDHDYDSKTGIGFLMLFIAGLAQFSISLGGFLIELRKRKSSAKTMKGT